MELFILDHDIIPVSSLRHLRGTKVIKHLQLHRVYLIVSSFHGLDITLIDAFQLVSTLAIRQLHNPNSRRLTHWRDSSTIVVKLFRVALAYTDVSIVKVLGVILYVLQVRKVVSVRSLGLPIQL